jgi:hypothetical protein
MHRRLPQTNESAPGSQIPDPQHSSFMRCREALEASVRSEDSSLEVLRDGVENRCTRFAISADF